MAAQMIYTRLGLVPKLDKSATIMQDASSLSYDREAAFVSSLADFLESLEIRLTAVSSVYDTLESYVTALNSFYQDKHVDVSLRGYQNSQHPRWQDN